MQKMTKHPLIVINPDMNCTSKVGDVLFPTQWCGIESEGTAYRMDTVPIRLRKIVEPPPGVLDDEQILKMILAEIRLIKAKQAETPAKALKLNVAVDKNKLAQTVEIPTKKRGKRKTTT